MTASLTRRGSGSWHGEPANSHHFQILDTCFHAAYQHELGSTLASVETCTSPASSVETCNVSRLLHQCHVQTNGCVSSASTSTYMRGGILGISGATPLFLSFSALLATKAQVRALLLAFQGGRWKSWRTCDLGIWLNPNAL